MHPLTLSKFSQILIPMEPTRDSLSSTERPSSEKTVVFSASAEPIGKSAIHNSPSSTEPASSEKIVVSSVSAKPNGKSIASSAMAMKPSAHASVVTANPMNRVASTGLSSAHEIANRVAAEVVTKPEAVTLEELFTYIKQETSKETLQVIGLEKQLRFLSQVRPSGARVADIASSSPPTQ
ncbi:hypothetical protein YC2023_017947 [Brassica napus]